jgi:hypothetical protein
MSTVMVGKNESIFPTIGFCVGIFLGIVGSQIEIEIIFSLARILTSLRRCRLQSSNLDKLIFVSKNWPNDLRIGCKSYYSLANFIESDINLNEEFEGVFERDEIMEL